MQIFTAPLKLQASFATITSASKIIKKYRGAVIGRVLQLKEDKEVDSQLHYF